VASTSADQKACSGFHSTSEYRINRWRYHGIPRSWPECPTWRIFAAGIIAREQRRGLAGNSGSGFWLARARPEPNRRKNRDCIIGRYCLRFGEPKRGISSRSTAVQRAFLSRAPSGENKISREKEDDGAAAPRVAGCVTHPSSFKKKEATGAQRSKAMKRNRAAL